GWAMASMVKMTEPPGVPTPGDFALTVAVKVTLSPATEPLPVEEEVRATALAAWPTCCDRVLVVARKFVSLPLELYLAVIVWPPTLRLLLDTVATPLPLRVPLPIGLMPSKKSTVPVGVPAPGAMAVTVAVKVTD